MVPDFLILGAAKSATTWLARELGRHPQVYVPAGEIHYFSLHPERPWSWYAGHFDAAGDALLVGEKSNTYLYTREAPERIVRALPGARLLAVLRHPVERAYSGYCMHLANGTVGPCIEAYLDPSTGDPSRFLDQGLYHRHLQRYLELFDRTRLSVSLFDDLVADSHAFASRVFDFLGADPQAAPTPGRPRNVRRRSGLAWPCRLAGWLEQRFPQAVGRLVAHPLDERARNRLVSRRSKYPPLLPDLRERMGEFFAHDIELLEALLGRDLSAWHS